MRWGVARLENATSHLLWHMLREAILVAGVRELVLSGHLRRVEVGHLVELRGVRHHEHFHLTVR